MLIHAVVEVFNFLVIHCAAKHFEVKFVHKSRLYPEEQPMHVSSLMEWLTKEHALPLKKNTVCPSLEMEWDLVKCPDVHDYIQYLYSLSKEQIKANIVDSGLEETLPSCSYTC